MVNDYGIPLTTVFRDRLIQFFEKKSTKASYLVIHYIWLVIFTIPFFVECILEFFILTILCSFGYLCDFLFSKPLFFLVFIWLIVGAIYGLLYKLISVFFYLLFVFLSFPNLVIKEK